MKTCIIVNPTAHHGKVWKSWPKLQLKIAQYFPEVTVRFTEYQHHAIELTRALVHEGYERILAVGGDGTNLEIVNGLFENEQLLNPQVQFGVIPLLTGLDLSRSLKMPQDMDLALNALQKGKTVNGDLGFVRYTNQKNEEQHCYFVNVASFGLHGEGLRHVSQSSRWFGKSLTYLMGAAQALISYRSLPLSLTTDNKQIYQGNCFFGAISNGQFFNGGMHIAPNADIGDGLLDLILIGDLTFLEHCLRAPLVYTGRHIEYENIHESKFKQLIATPLYHDDILVEADGELLGKLPATFEIRPSSVQFIVGE